MRTIFALFDNLENARAAVRELLAKGTDREAFNAILLEQVARDELDVNFRTVDVDVTDKVGAVTEFGLDRLLGGEQAVNIPRVGEVLAAGELATILAKTASDPDAAAGSLVRALEDFDVSKPLAKAYMEAIKAGSLLLFLRVEDEEVPEASAVLHANQGSYLSGT